mmetsp:Transcript_56059/g.126499  ORF Transcript_56059/g.126499 Transcript_56059/m.126499 type:complete len:248 (-) Transcript_56059:173-916(-)
MFSDQQRDTLGACMLSLRRSSMDTDACRFEGRTGDSEVPDCWLLCALACSLRGAVRSFTSSTGGSALTPSSGISGSSSSGKAVTVECLDGLWGTLMRSLQNSMSHSASVWMLSCKCNCENFRLGAGTTPALISLPDFPMAASVCSRAVMSCHTSMPVRTENPSLATSPVSKASPKSLMKRQPTNHSSSPKAAMHICLRSRKPPPGKTASQSSCSCGSGRSHCLAFGIFTSRMMTSNSTMLLRSSAKM